MTDRNMNNVPAPQNERRISLTQRLIGNARDWFQGDRAKEMPDFSKTFGDNSTGMGSNANNASSTVDGEERRPPLRQRSKSIGYFCEKRDIIIPGPVF